MNKSKSENSKKLINSKLLYTLPLACVGLCFTSQTANAMFKNSLSFFKKLESSSTGTSSPNIRPLTSSTSTAGGGSSLSPGGSRLPIQTPSSLGTSTKTQTSTTTSTTAASSSSTSGTKPKTSPSTSTKPVSSSSVGARTFTSSISINISSSEDKHKTSSIRIKPPSSGSQSKLYTLTLGDRLEATVELPSSSTSGARPKTSSSTSTKPPSSSSKTKSKIPPSVITKPPISGSTLGYKLLPLVFGDQSGQLESKAKLTSSTSGTKHKTSQS